jgi:hypothetical protein
MDQPQTRIEAIRLHLRGESVSSICRSFGKSRRWGGVSGILCMSMVYVLSAYGKSVFEVYRELVLSRVPLNGWHFPFLLHIT